MINKIRRFFEVEIWNVGSHIGGFLGWLLKVLRVFIVSIQDFIEDKCSLRASALTYYSVLSLVPILALFFGIAKGFGLDEKLRVQIMNSTSQNQELFLYLFNFAENTIKNTQGGIVAGIGIVVLLYTILNTLSLVEESFNTIWRVKQARSIMRKFTDYLSMMLIAPFMLVFSSSITVFLSSNIKTVAEKTGVEFVVGPIVDTMLQWTPLFLLWLLFLSLYMIMPNKKVDFKSALFAAVIAGTAYYGFEWVYISFQVGVSKYNAIYGSFAALPLFLIWLQISWTIVLFGAELSFAHSSIDELVIEHRKKEPSAYERLKVSIIILTELVKHYEDVKPFRSVKEIAEATELPQHRINTVIEDLVELDLIVTKEESKQMVYQPARDKDQLTISFVIESLLGKDETEIPTGERYIHELLNGLSSDLHKSPSNLKLWDLAHKKKPILAV